MTTAIKDLVCFLSKSELSAKNTWELLQKIDCKANRVILFPTPRINQSDDGYTLSFSEEYITVEISLKDAEYQYSETLSTLILDIFYALNIDQFLAWYQSAEAQSWTRNLFPSATIYYCNDLSAVSSDDQSALIARADLILTPGLSAFEFLKPRHDNVFYLPPPIDCSHFDEARYYKKNPVDQAIIPHPRIGHFGSTDMLDLDLVETLATQRHGWQFIFLSEPIERFLKFSNVHFLGSKSQKNLPDYISNWDIGFLPYGPTDVRRFLDPPQVTQILVAGKPVICTPMPDVMRRFEKRNLIHIAGTPADFMMKIQTELQVRDRSHWHRTTKEFLNERSIDRSLQRLADHLKSHYRFESISKNVDLQELA